MASGSEPFTYIVITSLVVAKLVRPPALFDETVNISMDGASVSKIILSLSTLSV